MSNLAGIIALIMLFLIINEGESGSTLSPMVRRALEEGDPDPLKCRAKDCESDGVCFENDACGPCYIRLGKTIGKCSSKKDCRWKCTFKDKEDTTCDDNDCGECYKIVNEGEEGEEGDKNGQCTRLQSTHWK